MTNIPNTTEEKLRTLAGIIGIPLKHGWKTDLAKKLGVELRVLSKWINRDKIPKKMVAKLQSEGYCLDQWLSPPDNGIVSGIYSSPHAEHKKSHQPPKSQRCGEKKVSMDISGAVGRERRAAWHVDPRKNELLRMAAFILQANHPVITPEFERRILDAHRALLAAGTEGPATARKKKASPI